MTLTLLTESTCDICIDEYTDGEQAPLVLPCGHPLCRRCLHSLKAPRRCPFCRLRLTWNDGRQLVTPVPREERATVTSAASTVGFFAVLVLLYVLLSSLFA